MSSRPRRLLAGLVLLTSLLVISTPVDANAGQPIVTRDQETVRALVNQTRGGYRLRGLAMHAEFAARATAWARELARCRCLKHRNGPYGAPAGWQAAAENVGRGWSFEQIHRAFLGSPPHRENILTPRYTHIGTGVARASNGEIFVVQAFVDLTR
jgi:uncharacterized protein YkwD